MPSTTSRLPAHLITIITAVFLLLLLLHLAGVSVLRHVIERELHPALPRGTYIGEVQLNLLTGLLLVEDFQLHNDGRLRMRFSDLHLDISPWRLLRGELHVEKATLAGGYLRVERRPEGSFDLGLPAAADDPTYTPAGPPPISLAGARIERVAVEYHDGDLASLLYVEDITAGAFDARAPRQEVPLAWRLQWDSRAVAGRARISLEDGRVAAQGELHTDPLDLGRAQQLARLAPLASGEAGWRGTFDWQSPRLRLAGAVQAPALGYRDGGRQLDLGSLAMPELTLDLQTAPALSLRLAASVEALSLAYRDGGQQLDLGTLALPELTLDLDTTPALRAGLQLGKGLRAATLIWRGPEQGAEVTALQLAAQLDYGEAGRLLVDQLQLTADRLAWQAAERRAAAAGVQLRGRLAHRPGTDALPAVDAGLTLASLSYDDPAAATSAQLSEVVLSDLALDAASADGAGQSLSAALAAAGGRVEQAASRVSWDAFKAGLQGRLGDAMQLVTDLAVDGLSVADPALPHGPLTVARVAAEDLALDEQTHFATLALSGIALPAALPATALDIAGVTLRDGSYSAQAGVAIGEIVIDGLQTGVVRDKAGVWQHVMSVGGTPAAPVAHAPEQTADAATAWRIGGVRVTGDSHLTVVDRTNPDMQPIRYGLQRVTIGAIASTAPNRDTRFDIALRPDRYSEFVISGKVRPLARQLYLDAEGHLHGFGLPTVNGLVSNDLGHRFLDGELDDDFRIRIEKQQLDMHNVLALAGVAVEEIPGKEGPPLSTAIALLEDRDGNIKLEVPVAGNLADPQFRVLGALNPIIMKAVAGTAALAIQPFGSVLLVGSLLADQALKVTFEPALFAPGSTALDPAAQKYLGQLAGRLAEKPKLAVRLCGLVVDAERVRDKKGAYLDQEADLLSMAQQRADAVRDFMAANGAAKGQLRTCRPAIDADAAGKPRVDIRF